MIRFKRKANITLDEFHRYVEDISEMQKQREEAKLSNNVKEYQQLSTNIEIALKVQERLLEQVE